MAAIIMVSCEKPSDSSGNDGENPIDIDRPITGEATVMGVVFDTNGDPMSGVNVTCGNTSAVTNAKGRFVLENAPEGNNMVVDFKLGGYMTTQKIIHTKKNTERLVYAAMTPIGKISQVDASTGGAAEHNGMSVEFPANAFVTEDGSAFTGTADVSITYVPTTTGRFTDVFPGDFSGVREDGSISHVESFGFSDITISANGQELKLADGIKAKLTYPIASAQQANAPTTIPLWYYDFNRGQWIEEGSASIAGNKYEGEVSHFTPWNIDKPIPTCTLRGKVVDGDGNPLPNAYVRINSTNRMGWLFTAYSDDNGVFSTRVQAEVEVSGIAYYSAVSSQIETTMTGGENSDNVLADLIIDLSNLEPGWDVLDFNSDNTPITDMFFLDCNIGWAVTGHNWNTQTPSLKVMKTTDGGSTWDVQSLQGAWKYESVSATIAFRDKNFGAIYSMFGAFYTTNGGDTWIAIDESNNSMSYMVDNIVFGSNNRISFIGHNGISTTTDLGATWENYPYPSNNQVETVFLRSHVVNDNEFYIFMGDTWRDSYSDFTILRTTDGGQTFTDEKIEANPFQLYFSMAGRDTVYMNRPPFFTLNGNKHFTMADGGLYNSLDRMSVWNVLAAGGPSYATSLFMLDENKIYVGTGIGGLFTSKDGGNTWNQYLTPGGGAITDIFMCDEFNGLASTSNGSILRFKEIGFLDL